MTSAAFDEVVLDVSGGNKKTPQSSFQAVGSYPIVDQGKDLVSGYTDDETAVCNAPAPVIVFGDHTRALKYVDFPFCMGADGIKVLRVAEGADAKFIYHYLRHIDIPSAGYNRHYKYLKRIVFRMPPIEEQRRIAAILDQAEALRSKRRQALAKLDTLTQSLFLEMFGDLELDRLEWPTKHLFELIHSFESGKSLVADDEDEQSSCRVLKVSAVSGFRYNPDEAKPVPPNYQPPSEHLVQKGDVLFSRANTAELVGSTAFVWETPGNRLLPDKLWRFVWRNDSAVMPLFVAYLFRQPYVRQQIARSATGTSGSMKNISMAKLLRIKIKVPPLELQLRFSTCIRVLRTNHQSSTISMGFVDTLFASLQHRAFHGEL